MEINYWIFRALRNLVFATSLVYFVYFIVTNIAFLSQLRNFSILSFTLIVVLKFLNIYFLSNINIKILENLEINLNNTESLDLVVKNSLGNLSSPLKLGSGYKLSYLKTKYDFKIRDYIVWTTFFSFINLYPLLIIFIFYSIIINNEIVKQNFDILFLFFVPLLAILFVLNNKNLSKKFSNLREFKFFSKNNLIIQTNNILFFISTTTVVFLIIQYFQAQINYFSSIAYSSLSSFVNIVNVTPGNIGVKEGLIVLFENIHNISYEIVLITSILERLLSFISLFIVQLILKNKSKSI